MKQSILRHLSDLVLVASALIATGIPSLSAAQDAPATYIAPIWRTQWVPWEIDPRRERPWRADARLAEFGIANYPDDFRAVFLNPDTTAPEQARMELMWVRLFAHDAATGRFLGYLLNQPYFIRSVRAGDNVVIRLDAASGLPTADGAPSDYAVSGWPADADSETGQTLRTGLAHYRFGNNGHNMPEIERCIATLGPPLEGAATSSWGPTRQQQFIAHYVLGRCLAEKYETDRAIRHFRAAIAIDSTDGDAQLALLAELSVLTHPRPGTVPPAELERRDQEFLAQLAIVRGRFAEHDGVDQILMLIFDPAQEADLAPEWRAQVERLRRVGYAMFRWKRR